MSEENKTEKISTLEELDFSAISDIYEVSLKINEILTSSPSPGTRIELSMPDAVSSRLEAHHIIKNEGSRGDVDSKPEDPDLGKVKLIYEFTVDVAAFRKFLPKITKIYNKKNKQHFSLVTKKNHGKKIVTTKRKSNEQDYKTKDVLTFVERDEKKDEHIVKVNKSKEFGIPYSSSGLLLLMAITLKENKKGWINKDLVKKGGLTVQRQGNDKQRLMALINKLRDYFKKNVKNLNVYTFIEILKGEYRLSIDPGNIKGKNLKWLKREYTVLLKQRKSAQREIL